MLKKIHWNTQKTPTKHVLRLFEKFLKTRFSVKKCGSQQISNYAKIPWNTQKTPTKHVLRLFKKFLKIRFLAEKSGSRLICRIMLKYHETLRNHQLNMFWGFYEKILKIRFSAEKSGSRLRFRTMLKCLETLRKHQLNMSWGFKRIFENPVLGSNIWFSAQMSNNAKNTLKSRKHQLNMFWGFLRIFWKSGSRLKNPVLGPDVEQC